MVHMREFSDPSLIPGYFEFKDEIDGSEKLVGYFNRDTLVGFIAYIEGPEHLDLLFIEVDSDWGRLRIGTRLISYIVSISDKPIYGVIGTREGVLFMKSMYNRGLLPKNMIMEGCD